MATFVAIFIFLRVSKNAPAENKKFNLRVSQSYIYELVSPAIPVLDILRKMTPKDTQSRKIEIAASVRVMVMGNQAYWIKDNAVYTAPIENNNIDKNVAEVVDIMHMDDVELKRMMFIIDKLTEGAEDDRGNSGNKNF